jgi:hypothetical protein
MKLTRQKLIAAGALAASIAVVALPAMATTIVPQCARAVGVEPPGLECIWQAFRNVANLLVGISGSFALLMFVWGGFNMVTSAGNEKKVEAGKKTLINATIGLILIFSSGYVVEYVLRQLVTSSTAEKIGQKCNDNRGLYADVAGVLTCVTQCAEMSDLRYQCMDATQGEDCNTAYAGCPSNQTCCIPSSNPAQ